MKISFNDEKDFKIITLEGRIDFTDAQEVREKFIAAADVSDKIIVDCTGLEYVSSSGLRAFLLLIKKFDKSRGTLFFTGISDEISQLLEITGISGFMKISPSLDEALQTA